jgi:hypothetical protein
MSLVVRINVPPMIPALEGLAEGLVRMNVAIMEEAEANGIDWPGMFSLGIKYRREPRGREWWESATDILGVLADRSGDCEDLAALRAAELRLVGEDEDARVKVVRTSRAFHAVVERSDGSIEDPSRVALALERARKRREAKR